MKTVKIACTCKDCDYSERIDSNNEIHLTRYCYYWDYEQGMEPNKVEADDFCCHAKKRNTTDTE